MKYLRRYWDVLEDRRGNRYDGKTITDFRTKEDQQLRPYHQLAKISYRPLFSQIRKPVS